MRTGNATWKSPLSCWDRCVVVATQPREFTGRWRARKPHAKRWEGYVTSCPHDEVSRAVCGLSTAVGVGISLLGPRPSTGCGTPRLGILPGSAYDRTVEVP